MLRVSAPVRAIEGHLRTKLGAVEHARGYDLIVWCDSDIPWTPDGVQRDGPAARDRANDLIATLVRDQLRSQGSTVIKVTGGLDDRLATVLAALA